MAGKNGMQSQIEQFNRRLQTLHDQINILRPPLTLTEESEPLLWAELETALEELNVAQAELQQQNDELITARQIAEAESARYSELFELAPDGYLVTDLDGSIQEANEAAANLFNVADRRVLHGKPLLVFVEPEDRATFREYINNIHDRNTKLTWDTRIVPRRKARHDVSVSLVLSHDTLEGTDVLRWQFRDITERKKAEDALNNLNQTLEQRVTERTKQLNDALEQEKSARTEAEHANQARLQFTAVIAHELRTPLTSILGFANTLLADDIKWAEADQHNFLEIIEEESRNLQELVNQLLDLARLDSGTFQMEKRPVALHDVIASVLAGSAAIAPRHRLVTHIPDKLPIADIDDRRIEQVVSNLIQNAAKYSSEQTTITVSAEAEPTMLRIDIADEGIGISPEERQKVFAPFHRIRKIGSANMGGAGLGLAICKGIVEAHGGHIWIQDRAGPGTTFSFTVPRAEG